MANHQDTTRRIGRPKGSKNGVATPNEFYTIGDSLWLKLTRGLYAVIDAADYGRVKHLRWAAHIEPSGAAYAYSNGIRGVCPAIKLHRLIAGSPPCDVDHEDRDGLNCRRSNLRPATRAQNNANRASKAGASSRFKGVTWDRARQKWKGLIQVNGRVKNLGRFNDEVDAATAYNFAAVEAFGDFARVNLP